MDVHRRTDAARELVALVQRRSLAILPLWASVAIVGAIVVSRATQAGGFDPIPFVYASGFALMWWLRRLHLRWYGDVRASDAQRVRGYLIGVAIFGAVVASLVLGPAVVPSPLPFVFAIAVAAPVVWEPWRVSLHWLLPAGVLLWVSVNQVLLQDPPGMGGGIESLATGLAGVAAAIVDHFLMVRRLRNAPREMAVEVNHVWRDTQAACGVPRSRVGR